jgi:hypothetical protein
VTQKYGIPFPELPVHCQAAVDAAESAHARTLVTRDGRAVAAIVPMTDLDRIDPPNPAVGGVDPLLTLCGACGHDAFVDAVIDPEATTLWCAHASPHASPHTRTSATEDFVDAILDEPSRS